ncbi:hypothetical protein SESBI_20677 [Sesbania bispinosa]|nr:hypothetical protein SESBI_20677 [Sesbania bispinosa]
MKQYLCPIIAATVTLLNGFHNSNIAPWGKFVRNEQNVLDYVGGEVDVWDELDCDLLNRFLIIDLCKLHKYHDIQHCFWLYPECNLEHPIIPDECVVFSKSVVVDETAEGEEAVEEDEDIPAEVVVGEADEEDEDVHTDVEADEEDEDVQTDVEVDEGLEKDSVSNVHSDSYESAEDSIYRPSPIVSSDDEEVTPIVAEIRKNCKLIQMKPITAAPTQTLRLAPITQGQPNINLRNPPYRPPGPISGSRHNYRGSTRRKLPTRGGLSIRPPAVFTGPTASSPTTVRPTVPFGPSYTTDPFHGQTASSGPISAASPFHGANGSSGAISASRPFQGASSSSQTTIRPSGTSGPTPAARPLQGASAGTANRFMQFIPTPGIHPHQPKKT